MTIDLPVSPFFPIFAFHFKTVVVGAGLITLERFFSGGRLLQQRLPSLSAFIVQLDLSVVFLLYEKRHWNVGWEDVGFVRELIVGQLVAKYVG